MKKKAALAAVVGGALVFSLKAYSWSISGSMALLSDAMESIVNLLASAMMYASVSIGDRPPDESHPYGHMKVESLSSLLEGALVSAAGVLIAVASVRRLISPTALQNTGEAIVFSLVATGLNGLIAWFLARAAQKTGSMALKGDSVHLYSDVLSSLGVVAGVYVAEATGLTVLDPLIALVVSGVVVMMGSRLVLESCQTLMDPSCPESEEKIREVLARHHELFHGYHDLRTRRSGERVYADLHLDLREDLTVGEAHRLMDHLEEELRREAPWVEVTIHTEPHGGDPS